jgi:PAS domain S-box-containing protein
MAQDTERKMAALEERSQLAELVLRESEARFRFLNDLNEATRTQVDPEQIMAVMARMLGEHLHASRCAYATVHSDGERFTILHDYTDGCASTVGNYHLSLFGARAMASLHNGHTLIVRNVGAELLPDDGADTFNAIGIKAIISCPLIKSGRLCAMMAVHQETPRDWTLGEVAIVQDVVERCWATIERGASEEKLRQSEALLRIAGRTAHVGGWVIDLPQLSVTWSEEVCAIHEVPSGTVPGLEQAFSFYTPPSRELLSHAFERCAKQGVPFDLELEAITAKGRHGWVRAIGEAVRNVTGAVTRVQGALQDVTQRKETARREEQHKQLVDASRLSGMAEVATNVLHNVGNVLTSVNVSAALIVCSVRASKVHGVTLAVQLMNEHADDLEIFLAADPKGKMLPGYLGQLAQVLVTEQQGVIEELMALTRSVDHIQEIIAAQQVHAGAASLVEPMQILDLVEEALRINAGALARSDLTVEKDFALIPELPLDKGRILQILVNLVRNAEQAMDAAVGRVHRLTLSVDVVQDRTLRIRIADSGIGIAPENLTRVFAHGFTTKKSGHGFGLHSAAVAAREMGGSLSAYSDGPGSGTTFTLELPVQACATR